MTLLTACLVLIWWLWSQCVQTCEGVNCLKLKRNYCKCNICPLPYYRCFQMVDFLSPNSHCLLSLILFSFPFFFLVTGALPSEKPAAHVPPKAEELSRSSSHKEGECPRKKTLSCSSGLAVPLLWLFLPLWPSISCPGYPLAAEERFWSWQIWNFSHKTVNSVRKETVVYLERPIFEKHLPS